MASELVKSKMGSVEKEKKKYLSKNLKVHNFEQFRMQARKIFKSEQNLEN